MPYIGPMLVHIDVILAYVGPVLASYAGPMMTYVGSIFISAGIWAIYVAAMKYFQDTKITDFFPSLEFKTMQKPRFLNIAKIKSVPAEGPETIKKNIFENHVQNPL